MATKKASSKKSKDKKVTKKTVIKSVKKSGTIKKAKSSKKVATNKQLPKAKKAVSKKAGAKKVVAKKAVAKKSAKPVAKKDASLKPNNKNSKVPSHSLAKETKKTKLDLSNFVTPLDDRLLVQISGAEKMTPGGLYIPDTVADVSGNLEGFVVAVGRGHMNKKGHLCPMDVKVGDRVVFSEYAGTKVKIQNLDLLILRESEVMGVVSK